VEKNVTERKDSAEIERERKRERKRKKDIQSKDASDSE